MTKQSPQKLLAALAAKIAAATAAANKNHVTPVARWAF